jgi:hypothetical protein
MNNSTQSIPKGYIAVLSSIILCVLLTALSFRESTDAFWNRFDQIDRSNHAQAYFLAQSCSFEELLLYAQNSLLPTTATNTPIVINTSCSIDPTSTNDATIILSVHSNFKNSWATVVVTAIKNSSNTVSITSLHESTGIPP